MKYVYRWLIILGLISSGVILMHAGFKIGMELKRKQIAKREAQAKAPDPTAGLYLASYQYASSSGEIGLGRAVLSLNFSPKNSEQVADVETWIRIETKFTNVVLLSFQKL